MKIMIEDMEKLEIDIEPNGIGEEEHLYVVVTDYNGTTYEGRIYPLVKEKEKLKC